MPFLAFRNFINDYAVGLFKQMLIATRQVKTYTGGIDIYMMMAGTRERQWQVVLRRPRRPELP
jgi:hypothetical protein